jgi:hypothetical protein
MIDIYVGGIEPKYKPTLRKLVSGNSFCGCCGTNFKTNQKRALTNRGVSLYPFKIGEEGTHKVNTVKHVETPDGIITIVTREKW